MKNPILKLVSAFLALTLLFALAPQLDTPAQAAAAYYIEVDITNQIVTVYQNGNRTESGKVAMMICSTGKASTPTPTGTFTLPGKTYSSERTEWYYFSEHRCYAKWATRIYSGILFHSVLYNSKTSGPTSTSVNALGYQASHGCIRLRVADAKWIAQHCPSGTKVRIYKSGKVNSTLRSTLLKQSWYKGSGTTTSTTATRNYLTIGDKGSNVTALQNNLIVLKLYAGAATGTYDAATANAVKLFQRYNSLSQTGNADPTTVSAIAAKAQAVSAAFKETDYKPVTSSKSQAMAKVAVSSSLNVRKSASTTAAILGKLSNNTVVIVLSKGSKWSKIQTGSIIGYCSNSYLRFYTGTIETLTYEAVVDVVAEPTPEPEPETTPAPETLPTDLAELKPSDQTLVRGSSGAAVRNLQYGLSRVKLYTGAISGDYDAATEEAVRVFQRAYKLSETGTATPALQQAIFNEAIALADRFADSDYTVTVSTVRTQIAKVATRSGKLNIRKKSRTSAKSLGRAPKGAKVIVLKKGKNWSIVQYGRIVGYCQNRYLKFSVVTTTTLAYEAVPTPPVEETVVETPTLVATETPAVESTPVPEEAAPTATAAPETTEPTPAPASEEKQTQYAVVEKADTVIYRDAKVDAEAVLLEPEVGSFYTVLETGDEWTKVSVDAQNSGYILTASIRITTVRPDPQPEPTAQAEPAPTEQAEPVTTETPDPAPEATEAPAVAADPAPSSESEAAAPVVPATQAPEPPAEAAPAAPVEPAPTESPSGTSADEGE